MVQKRIGSGQTVGMMVRVSEGLRDRIKSSADANGRSQNSEIVATLEEAYPPPPSDELVTAELMGEVFNLMAAIATAGSDDERSELLKKHAEISRKMHAMAKRNEAVRHLMYADRSGGGS